MTDDHRALLAEYAERTDANETITTQRHSASRRRHALGWAAGLGSLYGIDALFSNAATGSAWPLGAVVVLVLSAAFIGRSLRSDIENS